jgi:hypothetical protein
MAVDLEEREHRDECGSLVAVDEWLSLGDPVGEYRGLKGQIGTPIVSVGLGPAECAFERVTTPEMLSRLC